MNSYREKALRLRMAGKSYNEIRKEIPVAKSTLSLWLRDIVLSDTARERIMKRMKIEGAKELIRRNKLQTHHAEQRARKAQTEGKSRIVSFSSQSLLMLGAALYWAEGYKRLVVRNGKERMGHRISFLNTDPAMIATFVRFLKESLDVPEEKIQLTMRLYPHINEREARQYWMRASGLPESAFTRTTMMVSEATKRKRPFNRLPYGTLCVAVADTQKFHHLLGLIEGVKAKSGYGKMASSPG